MTPAGMQPSKTAVPEGPQTPFTGKIPVVKKVQVERTNKITSIMVDLVFRDGLLVEVGQPYSLRAGDIIVVAD